MPFEAVVVCTLVVAAFVILALTLAWAQQRTTR